VVRRIPIRAKVAGALAVPLLGLAAAAGIGVSANAAATRDVIRQTQLAAASIGRAGLIEALQNERNLALLTMLGLTGGVDLEVGDAMTARQLTDSANIALRREISRQSDGLRSDYTAALDTLTDLPDVRELVDAAAAPGPANRELAHDVFDTYTAMVSAVFASHDRFPLVADDATLRQGDDLVRYSSHATDAVAKLVDGLLFLGSGPGGIDRPVEAAEIAELRRDVDRSNALVDTKGTGVYAEPAEDVLANRRVIGLPQFAGEAIARGGEVDPAGVLATTPLGPDGGYLAFRDAVVEVLDARADSLRDEADARRRLYLGSALAVVVAALVIAWWVTRSITRPLRDLSVKARSMATYRLPVAVQDILAAPPGEDLVVPEAEPIVVRARDEVADVAGALNDVQESAIGLAVEQAALRRNVAESYLNLGRRNQNLLSRLLAAVGDLEYGETDTDRLGQLYRLDHLATRIRRNAESLLVLSQNDAPIIWQPPVDLADVVRAALGEIENYERVLVRTLDPTMILGGAAADVAHLLAELIENGLRHSPPRELVEVSGRVTNGGYTVTIVDHGLGMTPDDIERANQRLAGVESFTVTPAKYLGHYVTAVLAARHGIEVRLKGSVVVGIAALVTLPAALIAGSADHAPPATVGAGDAVPADDDQPAAAPSADELRSAIAVLRSGAVGSPASPAAVPTAPAAAVTSPAADTPVPPLKPASLVPVESATVADPARPDGLPERTASGLVRRVRGAHVPVGAAVARADAPAGAGAPVTADEPSSPPVDGAEIQRFLTNLVGGVQRSLDEQSPANGDGDEGCDDAH
jgi:Histidine kinase-, DNA gyrase B-, and HSP90-like ATPase